MAQALAWCHRQPNPLDAFNHAVLGRGRYWRAQREICKAVMDPTVSTVVVPAGHSVGKSFVASGIVIGWLTLRRDSLVITTSPSNDQLKGVLWKEIRKAFNRSPLGSYGRITGNPEKLDYGDGQHALGFSTTKPERAQGHHSHGPLLLAIDEASGVDDLATHKSLKPWITLLIGNTLRSDGPFYDAVRRGEDGDRSVRVIRVPSTDSPDIHLEHSPRGLADASWLREMEADYGVGSLVWKTRVLALFPDDSFDQLIPRAWIDLAAKTLHVRSGPARTTIDLAEGRDGDNCVVMTRDDNGILAWEMSPLWDFDRTAEIAAKQVREFGVEPARVVFDASGIGADFANRLESKGIRGARAYRGGGSGNKRYANLRSAAAWLLRQRLDPDRMVTTAAGLLVKQHPFSLPADFAAAARVELQNLRYTQSKTAKIELQAKAELARVIRRSPDLADTLIMSFAFP